MNSTDATARPEGSLLRIRDLFPGHRPSEKKVAQYVLSHVQWATASLLGPGDVAIGISHTGFTHDNVSALRIAREASGTTVCVTNHFDSPVTAVSDIRLYTAAQEPALRSSAIASHVEQLSIIDVLFIGVAGERSTGRRVQ